MTDVNINAEVIEFKSKTVEKNRGAERGIAELSVNIKYKNGIVNELHTDEVTAGNVYYLLNELREELLKELE